MNASEFINQLKLIGKKDYTREIGMDCLDDEMVENARNSSASFINMNI